MTPSSERLLNVENFRTERLVTFSLIV